MGLVPQVADEDSDQHGHGQADAVPEGLVGPPQVGPHRGKSRPTER